MFADQVALEVAAGVMSAPSGAQHLRCIHHLISNNSDWLLQQLDIPLPLPAAVSAGGPTDPKTLRFQLKLTPEPEEKFVSTVEHNRIGACSFDQVSWIKLVCVVGLNIHFKQRRSLSPPWNMTESAPALSTRKASWIGLCCGSKNNF